MAFGWEGALVRLVPLDKDKHLANAMRWLNDPEVTEWTLVGDLPVTRLGEEAYFDRMMKGPESDIALGMETLEGLHIGFTGAHKVDYRQGVATTGSIIGDKDYWSRGFGTDAARVRTRYLFDVIGLRLLLSDTLGENERSQRMLKRVGYREVGRIPRRDWKHGTYHDRVLFALHREDWLALHRAEAARSPEAGAGPKGGKS